jgi:hypothetical protein
MVVVVEEVALLIATLWARRPTITADIAATQAKAMTMFRSGVRMTFAPYGAPEIPLDEPREFYDVMMKASAGCRGAQDSLVREARAS